MAWVNGISGALNDKQQMQNAQMLVNGLYGKKGWRKESVSALIGNAHAESSVNPSRHEIGGAGYGLLQWTPMQKLVNYCNSIGKKYTTGEAQLAMINHEVDAGLQWIPNRKGAYAGGSSYRGSYKDFRTNKDKLSVNALTEAFMWNYEGPRADAAYASLATRQAFANRAFKELKWDNSDPGGGGGGSDPGSGDDNPTNVLQKDPVKVFKAAMEQMFTNIYFQNNNYLYKNFFIKITKQMNNMYKIKPTFDFSKMSLKDINDLFGLWHPESNSGGGNTGGGGSGGGGDKKGYYWPFKQDTMIMTSPFGPRNDSHGFHQGIDLTISNQWGKPICAIHSGTVLVAGDAGVANGGLPGWEEAGSMIVIKNDDKEGKYVTYEEYAPGTNQVKKGDKVKGGQIIAHTGVSGNSTGVHLHLGISDPPNPPTAYNVIPPALSPHWHDPSPYIGIANKAGTYNRPKNINKP